MNKNHQLIKHINEQIMLRDAYGLTDKGQGYLEGLTKALLLIDDNASKHIVHNAHSEARDEM